MGLQLPDDIIERFLLRLGNEDRASAALACKRFHSLISSSSCFFPAGKLGAEPPQGDSQLSKAILRQRLQQVGPALHATSLSGRRAELLPLLPSLRSLVVANPACEGQLWGQLAALHSLSRLSLRGVGQLSGLLALENGPLRSLALELPYPPGIPGWAAQLAEGLPRLARLTKHDLRLPVWGGQGLDEALGALTSCRCLFITTAQPEGAPFHPGAWVGLHRQLTELILSFVGDSTLVGPGLARFEALKRLSVVGAGERSPQDLFQACGLEMLAVAGLGGLPPVPDCLDAHNPHLRSLEASYGALGTEGSYPVSLCLAQLTQIDLFNAGLENCKDCPHHALPEAFSKLTGLKSLSLAKNFLEVVPPSLCGLTSVTYLSLWGNRLASLPGGPYLRGLRYLNASANELMEIPAALVEAGLSLEKLGLCANPISTLTVDDAQVLAKLTSLRVLGFGSGAKDGKHAQARAGGLAAGAGSDAAAASNDLQLALLWVMAARGPPGCDVRFKDVGFLSRWA